MKVRPEIFVGAAENPFAGPNVELRALRLGKKIAAGRNSSRPSVFITFQIQGMDEKSP